VQLGFPAFSGATRASAAYVLERRLGLQSPVLIAMEDALESLTLLVFGNGSSTRTATLWSIRYASSLC